MPSINVDLHFFSHRKTMRLAAQLGDQAVTCLLKLWCYTAQHYPESGSLQDLSDVELEHIMQWKGEPGLLVRALVGLGFLDVINASCHIHGWGEHAKHLVAYREKAKKAAAARWGKDNCDLGKFDAPSIHQASSVLIESTSYAPSIASSNARTEPSIVPIQYKTIQEKNKKEKNMSGHVQKQTRPQLTDDAWLESLKTNPAYQHINLTAEFGKMDAWFSLPKNKYRKKTRQFILNWLNKIDRPLSLKQPEKKRTVQL